MTKRKKRRGKERDSRRRRAERCWGREGAWESSWVGPTTSSKVAKQGHGYDFAQRMYSLEKLERTWPSRESSGLGVGPTHAAAAELSRLRDPVRTSSSLRSLQRRRRSDERTVWSSQLWCPTFHSTEQRENLAGGKPQQAGIFQNWGFSPLNAHVLWRGPDSQRQKLLSGPRLQGDWKPHPHVSSSQWGKKGLWGQRSERGLLDWNVRMWADLDGRGACGKAFRSLWEPFWWDVALGLSEALNDVLGGCFPLSVADPIVLRVLGLRLLQAGWTQMSREPLYLLPASVGRQVVAPWCGRPWDKPEHHLGLLCNNRLSILSAFKATYGGGPQDAERVRQSTGVFSLGSWRNLLHPGYPALCSGPDPYGLCQRAPLLTDTQWARSSGEREASEIWAWAQHLPAVPPDGIALTSKEISEENVSLKCYMVPSHACSKWLTMHMWSLPHIHSWNSGKLVWRDCDRRLWGTTSDLSSAASISHCDCPSGNRDGASGLSKGSPLPVTGHFSLFPRAKHQIVQLLILHYTVTSCRQGASSFDLSWSYSQRHVVQSLSMRLWNRVSCTNPPTGHLAWISTLPACPVKVKVE